MNEEKLRVLESLFRDFGLPWGQITVVSVQLSFNLNDNKPLTLTLEVAPRAGGGS